MESIRKLTCSSMLLLLFALLAAVSKTSAQGDGKLAISLISSKSLELKAPFYMDAQVELSEEYRELVGKHTRESLEYLNAMLASSIDRPSGFFGAGKKWIGVALELRKISARQKSERAKYPNQFSSDASYKAQMQAMIKRIMQNRDRARTIISKGREQAEFVDLIRGGKLEGQRLKEKLDSYLATIIEGVEASPASAYVDWSRATLNGQSFELYSGQLIGELSEAGFGTLFSLLESVVNFVLVFKHN